MYPRNACELQGTVPVKMPIKPVKYAIKIMCCTDGRTNYLMPTFTQVKILMENTYRQLLVSANRALKLICIGTLSINEKKIR